MGRMCWGWIWVLGRAGWLSWWPGHSHGGWWGHNGRWSGRVVSVGGVDVMGSLILVVEMW